MAIGRKQIGWSQESNLLWEISRQMEKLTGVVFNSGGGGGGVQSVTGLDTDNTDPLNPVVQISVDGTTITGAGTPASPLAITTALPVIDMNVDLAGGDFDLAGAGIYMITNFGNLFLFNNTGIVDGSRVIVTNSNALSISSATVGGTGVSVLYQGTQKLVTQIPSGMSYEFIYNSTTTTWYCLNPQPQPTDTQDIGGLVNPYEITTIGYYKFLNTGGGAGINLPNPTAFVGQEITIWSYDPTDPITIGSNQPKGYSGASIGAIPTASVLTVVSIGGEWIAKAFLP